MQEEEVTPLDAAKALATIGHARNDDCMWPIMPHDEDCPYRQWPKIVAAMEAAKEVAGMILGVLLDHHDCLENDPDFCPMLRAAHHVWFCDGCDESAPCDCHEHEEGKRGADLRAFERLVHGQDCPLDSLTAAFR